MEDQRNWTDASYKTYPTPLDNPFPINVDVGQEFNQKILLNLTTNRKIKPVTNNKVTFDWDNNLKFKFPN